MLFAVVVRDGFQHALHARAAGAVVRREVGAAEKRLAVGREKGRERPAALAGERSPPPGSGRRCRGARRDPPYGDEGLVDDARHLGFFVTLAVHHVAPVAPHRADVEQDGLVLALRAREGLLAPLVPAVGWCMAERK